jgi:hypothetical protein
LGLAYSWFPWPLLLHKIEKQSLAKGIFPLPRVFPVFPINGRETFRIPTDDHGSVAYVAFKRISEEDHNFLDEILQKQNQDGQQQDKPAPTHVQKDKAGIIGSGDEPVLKGELVINTADVKRSDPATHKETVKRAQLVTHNETFKRAEMIRSSRQ